MELSSSVLSDIVVHSKYAKFIPAEKRRETWEEIVARNQAMHTKRYPALAEEIATAYEDVLAKRVLPSMRSLQFAGKPVELSPVRLYNCLSQDTAFITSEGVKTFADYADGDVISVLAPSGAWQKAIVRSYGEQQLNRVYVARGRNLQSVRATANHRWVRRDGTVTTSLKVGDSLLAGPSIFDEFDYDDAEWDERLYWAYGYVFGDGTVFQGRGGSKPRSLVRLCGADKGRYLSRFEELGFVTSTPQSLCGDAFAYTGEYLKTAPDPTVDSPRLIRAFVAGYLAADGGKSPDDGRPSKYASIVATGEKHQQVVENLFPIAGVYVTRKQDLSGEQTNLGTRGNSAHYGLSTAISNRAANVGFVVKSILPSSVEKVWCLEVENESAFVLATGLVTGNCAFMPMDHFLCFSEAMFLLLSGTGVGYSVQKHHVKQLPEILKPRKTRRYLIGDSIEGWADAVKALVRSYLDQKPLPAFDFSDIRAKGTLLQTAGGRAPGPEPLKECLHNIQKIFDRHADHEKLSPLDTHDILCFIAEAVLSGGIRRSAMISLFSLGDEEMLTSKFGNWYERNAQRAFANNSAVVIRHKVTRATFDALWEKIQKSGSGEPGIFFSNDKEMGTNPCCEISLRPYQFCNLSTINVSDVTTQEELERRARVAAFLGTLQAGYTDFHYLREIWKETTERDALIGVSMTGIATEGVLALDFTAAAEVVRLENNRVAKLIGINEAARMTCVKPEGTTSLVLGSSSGIHAWHDNYYIRRLRVMKSEAIYKYLKRRLPQLVEDEFFKPTEQAIISLPIKAPAGAITRAESAIDLLNRVSKVWREWVQPGHRGGSNVNNVSCTVTIRPGEWGGVAEWMWAHRTEFSGLAVLPEDGGTYVQPPFESIDRTTYEELLPFLKAIDLSHVVEDEDATTLAESLACGGGGSCEIV